MPPAVAPGDGDVAYTYTSPPAGSGSAQSYVTCDRGATWTRAGAFAVGSPPSTQTGAKPFVLQGAIVVAADDPAIAVTSMVWLQAGATGDVSLYSNAVTFDSGAHWQTLPGHATFSQLATYQGRIYAQRLTERAGGTVSVLFVSTDHMSTWQPIDTGLPAPVHAFRLSPSTGALLAETDGQGVTSDLFYTSTDAGATWKKLAAPQFNPTNQGWIVQIPVGSQPWRICAVTGPTSPNGNGVGAQPAAMTCSIDGGQTWVSRPALNLVEHSPKGFQFYASGGAFAIAADGAVLASAVESPMHIYRLPAGATVWQDLGPQPNSSSAGPTYYPTVSGGVLWWSGGAGASTATYPPA
jgi:hypothetical protein